MVVIVVLIIVLAAAAGVALRWWQDSQDTSFKPKDLPETIQKSQDLASTGDFAGAHEEIEKNLEKSNLSEQQKYELYFQEGATYFNEGKYQLAIDSYKKAATFQESRSLYESMAIAAEQLGDKELAISSYKKAIEHISDSNPHAADDQASYEARIRELGGQP
jgi:tetratricopeptide (TPR) repeat protein